MPPRETKEERHEINRRVVEEFRANGGKVGGRYENAQLLLLTTVGAKSGEERIAPLGYTLDGDNIVIIAARGGGRYNPDWYHNILANPIVGVEVGADRFTARAHVLSGAERERVFNERCTPGSALEGYRNRTKRVIPVIVLERLEQAAAS